MKIVNIGIQDIKNDKNIIMKEARNLDTPDKETIGLIKATVENNKSYAHINFPDSYVEQNTMTSQKMYPHVYIQDLVVDKKYRGNGIGSFLVSIIANDTKKMNLDKIILLASSEEVSPIPFYKKLGFMSGNPIINRMANDIIKAKGKMAASIGQFFMYLPQRTLPELCELAKKFQEGKNLYSFLIK